MITWPNVIYWYAW